MNGTVVVFACLHTQTFTYHPPSAGSLVWCPRCDDYREVTAAPHEYNVDCDNCTYHRAYGNAPLSAETAASNHAVKRAGHRVVLSDGGEVVNVFHHPVIHVDVTVPPF